MVKTPTYHVFDLYKEHQGGEAVYCWSENEQMTGGAPMLSTSASVKDGVLTITAANCSMSEPAEISCGVSGFAAASVKARILTGAARDLNDFDCPEKLTIKPLEAKLENGVLKAELPPCSAAEIRIFAE